MFCTSCGAKNEDHAKFCTSCGQVLNGTTTSAPASEAQQPAATPPVPTPAPVAPQPQAPVQQSPVYNSYNPNAGSLNFKIFGDNLPAVSIRMNAGESIYTQSGGMTWMDNGIQMETNMKGGLMKGLGRVFSGDSLFIATYTANQNNQEIVIASNFPGHIAAIDIGQTPIIAQKSAFLCAQPSVTLSAYVTRSAGAGFFGGEGFIMQRLTGAGMAFLEIDGSLVERTLAPGETIKVDTGNVAAFAESVHYQAEMVKGFKNILFGGEGLFLTTLTGPGKVWLQTMTMPGFAGKLIPYLPKSGN